VKINDNPDRQLFIVKINGLKRLSTGCPRRQPAGFRLKKRNRFFVVDFDYSGFS
jgi:hypothetical protein